VLRLRARKFTPNKTNHILILTFALRKIVKRWIRLIWKLTVMPYLLILVNHWHALFVQEKNENELAFYVFFSNENIAKRVTLNHSQSTNIWTETVDSTFSLHFLLTTMIRPLLPCSKILYCRFEEQNKIMVEMELFDVKTRGTKCSWGWWPVNNSCRYKNVHHHTLEEFSIFAES
jgi:hypothetical protein